MERLNRQQKDALRSRFSPLPRANQRPTNIDNTPVLDSSNGQLLEDVQQYVSFDRQLSLHAMNAYHRDRKGNPIGIDEEKAVRTKDKNSRNAMADARRQAKDRKEMEVLFRRIHEELRNIRIR